jgi:transcriptional regulator with XRE-family HTH domain
MLNERLKNLRLAKGLTLQQVGDVFGISAASVASWEKGRNQPDSRKISKLAEFLGSSVEFLLNGSSGSTTSQAESINKSVFYIPWARIESDRKPKKSDQLVHPLYSNLSTSGFATRYPGSEQYVWSQGPVPAGATIFIDPDKEIKSESIVLLKLQNGALDLAQVQVNSKSNAFFLKVFSSGDSLTSNEIAAVLGTVVEWRISGKL